MNPKLNKKVKKFLDAYFKGTKASSPEAHHAIMFILKGELRTMRNKKYQLFIQLYNHNYYPRDLHIFVIQHLVHFSQLVWLKL